MIGSLGDFLSTKFNQILNFLNPTSDTFFLKIAFVPRENFFEQQNNNLKNVIENQFPFLDEIRNGITNVSDVSEKDEWDGIEIDGIMGSGPVKIIDSTFVNYVSSTVKMMFSAFIWVVFGMYIYRRLATILDS